MSIKKLWQIGHIKELDNAMLTAALVVVLRENRLTTKQIALELAVPTERVRNWYYRNTGMTALDLLKMLQQYEFIRQSILN